jgi:hypothetical protein
MKDKSKEEFKMATFIITTLSLTVAIILASIILTVASFAAMGNAKFMKWLTNYYMKQMMRTLDNFEKLEESKDL